MRLYLVQHGEARPKTEDPERNLTEKGARDVERMAAFIEPLALSVPRVLHSGKPRATRTAEILAAAVGARDIAAGEGLAPNDDVRAVRSEVEAADRDLMLVGHIPFVEKLASLLVAGSESARVVAFRQGGVVCIERADDSSWAVLWAVTPEILP
jgi:phosphohistidine phosphatase